MRFLSNQLTAAVQKENTPQSHEDGSETDEEGATGASNSEDNVGEAAGKEATSLVTGGLRDEIRAMEAYVFGLVGSNLAKRKSIIHSAVAEDGRVAAAMGGQSAEEAGPWKVSWALLSESTCAWVIVWTPTRPS